MDAFTQKLRVIYKKLFQENIDDFTEALIDYKKFDKNKFDLGSESECKKQFFLNRKTVLRRWLQKGSSCTSDFQKSYSNYKLSHYQLKGKALFSIGDFKKSENLAWFDAQIDTYLKNQKRVEVKVDYKYLYFYDEETQQIHHYEIIEWIKGKENAIALVLRKEDKEYEGSIKLDENNNIFLTINHNSNKLYILFHNTNDSSSTYIVGVSMGFSKYDNKVPRSQKLIFSKELLNTKEMELAFILNETETLTAIENRLNLNREEVKVNQFTKYTNKFRKYNDFFKRLRQSSYKESFYYRLAFREFYAIKKLFKKVAKEESYYILDYQRAFLELLKTVEEIGNISLQIVMQLDAENILMQSTKIDLEIKSRLLNLYTQYGIETSMIFVLDKSDELSTHIKYLLTLMQEHHIKIKLIQKESIISEVNSIDFTFIHLEDKRDFVLADPIRDSKDVYKLFTDELTMDEYRIDYQKILMRSHAYSPQKRGE